MVFGASMLAVALAATAEHAEKKVGLPQLNPEFFSAQLFWLAISFGFLYFVLSRVALPRISEVIEERRSRIQRDLDEAERLQTETDKALATYEQKLAEARGRANTMAQETRDKLTAEVDAERAKVEAEVAAKLADAEKTITAKKNAALAQVGEIATSAAGDVVERLLGESVTADEIRSAMLAAGK